MPLTFSGVELQKRVEDADAAYGLYAKPKEDSVTVAKSDENADVAYGLYARPGGESSK